MTKVLVTGATGLLGGVVVPHLRAKGHEVISQSRSGDTEVRIDLSDTDQVRDSLDRLAPEVILNLAGLTNVDECERYPQLAYTSNVRIVENLARWIRTIRNPCFLIQISTDQLYDGADVHLENDVTLRNYYAFSKFAGELAALAVPSTVMRTNFFGPGHSNTRQSISDWIVHALRSSHSITVFEDVRFSPLSMRRLAELTELAVRKQAHGLYNVGARTGMSKADFAFALADVLSLPARGLKRGNVEDACLRAYRPRNMCMDSSHFEQCFGVRLPDLESEIQSMKEAYAHEAR